MASRDTEFDYIICGGGPSGCAVAARLAEDPNVSVLHIEAGGNCLDVENSRSDGPTTQTLKYFTTECGSGPPKLPLPSGRHAFAIITQLFSPLSKGTVTLKSCNPLDDPIIDHNYLSHPLDVTVLAEGVRLSNEIITEGNGTKDLILNSYPEKSRHHLFKSREEWIPYVRQAATTCYHPAGTCKMGKPYDKMSVLDERLRFEGWKA